LQPPTADALYARIAVRTDDGEISSVLQSENDIADFVMLYSDDSRVSQMRAYERDIDLYRLERKFERVKGPAGADGLSPVEQMYLEAIGYARLDAAVGVTKLQALVDLYSQPEDTTGPTGRCLMLANRRLAQLRKEVDKLATEQTPRLTSRLDAADAMRLGEPERAAAIYRAVIELYGDKPWAADLVSRARESLAKKP
jgi:eukaryotic-like serine/threonine-protein kinase